MAHQRALRQLLGLAVWLGTTAAAGALTAQVWDIRWRHVRRAAAALQHPLLTVKGAAVSPWSVLKAADMRWLRCPST